MFALYSSMKRPRRAAGGTPVAWTIAVPLALQLCASPLEVGGDHFQFQFNLLKFISYRKQVTIFAGKSLKKNVQTKLSCVKTNVPMGSKALATS